MPTRELDPNALRMDEDWVGNNAAFTCPVCGKVFLVSQIVHRGSRPCPKCDKSTGRIKGGSSQGGTASLEWPD
jgi:hypothetical protein